MFVLYAEKTQLAVQEKEPVTSGSVNVSPVQFAFSRDWEDLEKTAVFRSGGVTRSVLLDASGLCEIPWEVLTASGRHLFAGIQGTRGEDLVLPTVWADLGLILEGAAPGEDARPPTPELWEQALAKKGDALDYAPDGGLGLWSGDRLLSSVPIEGGGEGGTGDHRRLAHRDAAEQHPIRAIAGLEKELDRIPEPVEALTNTELEEMLR